jgi:hypothetical protein
VLPVIDDHNSELCVFVRCCSLEATTTLISRITLIDLSSISLSFSPSLFYVAFFLGGGGWQDSVIGQRQSAEEQARGASILASNNHNFAPTNGNSEGGAKSDGGAKWFDGVSGHDRRFVPFNGGFGQQQLAWLAKELSEAGASGTRVVLLSHAILHPSACGGTTMAWDFPQALEVVGKACEQWPGTVALVLAGHDHSGGFYSSSSPSSAAAAAAAGSSAAGSAAYVAAGTRRSRSGGAGSGGGGIASGGDPNGGVDGGGEDGSGSGGGDGVQHVTLKSPLNLGEKGDCFGCVDVFEDRLVLRGPNLSHLVHKRLLLLDGDGDDEELEEGKGKGEAAARATADTASTPAIPTSCKSARRFFVDPSTGDECVEFQLRPLTDRSRQKTGDTRQLREL